jgi:hypothetical protein
MKVAGVLTAGLLLAAALPVQASEPLDMFDSEAAALEHCANNPVVWLDVPSHTFWLKGRRGYGASKNGGYTCEKDAIKSGNREKFR